MRKTLLAVVGLMVVMAMLLSPLQSSAQAQATVPPKPKGNMRNYPRKSSMRLPMA